MAFVTLDDFFQNYRMKNQQQPNETVLNRGLMRLKRETRELKSLVDILVGNTLTAWNSSKIYEVDEYISYDGLVFQSLADRNFNNIPDVNNETYWALVTLEAGGSNNTVIKTETYTATEGQTQFTTPFNIDSNPMVIIDGMVLSADRYSVTDNVNVELVNGAAENEIVTIISGVTLDSSLVIAKERFVAEAGQYLFVTQFTVKSPSVFVDGVLQDEDTYSWSATSIELNDPLVGGEHVIIGNGSVLGSDIYSTDNVDDMLSLKRDISDSYSSTEVDNLLAAKATITYVDGEITTIDNAKADWGTTLADYNIGDAYTKTQVDTALTNKLDTSLYLDAIVLQKILNVDGAGSGLDADLFDGLDSEQFIRSDVQGGKLYDFNIYTSVDPLATEEQYINEIYFDVESDTPDILLRTYDENGDVATEGSVYTNQNTSHMMVIKEGYFKGTWEPTLDGTFGISDYADYNWTVVVTPVLTGYEHDYNKDFDNGHTPYTGFDNNLTWDENQSEYHYGYIDTDTNDDQTNIVKMQSIHKNGSQIIDTPARYHLVGVIKTFSSYEFVNQ